MSYDLTLRTRSRLADQLTRLGMEIHDASDGYVVCLNGTDEDVSAAWTAVVALARAEGATLFDPQVGAEIDLAEAGPFPPMWSTGEPTRVPLPAAPTSNGGVGIRLYTVSIDEARQTYVDRFGGTVLRESEELLEVALCGVVFSLRVKARRRRAQLVVIGEIPHRVRADAIVITLPGEAYERMAERVRRTGQAPFEFAFEPAERLVPGEPPAHCFVVSDGNQNFIEFRRA